jgi:hypothetical protein
MIPLERLASARPGSIVLVPSGAQPQRRGSGPDELPRCDLDLDAGTARVRAAISTRRRPLGGPGALAERSAERHVNGAVILPLRALVSGGDP